MPKVNLTNRVVKSYEVEFPLYRVQKLTTTTLFTRVTEDGQFMTIVHTDDGNNIAVKTGVYEWDQGNSPEYHLGQGQFALSPLGWENALQQARKFMVDHGVTGLVVPLHQPREQKI